MARSRTHGRVRIEYRSPIGTESNSEVNNGKVTLELRRTDDIGTPGDAAVSERIEDALRARGHAVSRLRAKDDRGEDALLVRDDRAVIIQVVTAPEDSQLFAAAANGVAQTEETLSATAEWLELAVGICGVCSRRWTRATSPCRGVPF